MRFLRFVFVLLLPALLAAAAHAQTVQWAPGDPGMPNSVQLIFENCEPEGEPNLPAVPGVTFAPAGRSDNTSASFGPSGFVRTRQIVFAFTIRSRQNAPVQIPGFVVRTDKGPIRVPPYTVTAPGAPLDAVASAKLIPERTTVWAGEVFGLTYELTASRRANPQISPTFDWNAAPLVAEDWSKPEVNEVIVNGERRAQVLFRTRAFAKSANTVKLEAASHLLSIQTGTIGFGIIQQPRMESVSVTADQPVIEVKALPTPPPGFSGAVGQFKLVSKVVPEKAVLGEPVTWTLELSGTGNWPDIAGLPARDVSNDFQVVQPKAKRTPAEGKLFDVTLTEDVVLVPTKAGSYTLGGITFVYFDPKTGAYERQTIKPASVTIAAPAAPRFNVMPQPPTPSTLEPPERAPAPAATPAPLQPIPRDPLPGATSVRAPMSRPQLAVWLASPVPVLLCFWLYLALRRARQTDPVRSRREARDRLAQTLQHLNAAGETERATLLLAWQREAAALWQIYHAAPRADMLPDQSWRRLWSDADRAIYGARVALPADWIARAQETLAAVRLPGFKLRRVFLPQNLMPFAAGLVALLAVTTTLLHAASLDPLAAYRKGEFEAAEKSWRDRLRAAPTDWIARHNLSLALAQLERAGEAAAHAAAAFVQKPSDSSVRWHFALAAERAGAAPAVLSAFVNPGPLQTIGRFMSAANWQLAAIAAAWLAGATLGWLLLNGYRGRVRRVTLTAASLLGLSLGLAGFAAAGVHSYGVAGNADAVVVARGSTLRSVPTEADLTQKTSPLAAGSLAIADKNFLGWIRLSFDNGQTGWVRKDDVVGLWK